MSLMVEAQFDRKPLAAAKMFNTFDAARKRLHKKNT